ncbi:lasso RiPP family leader peptide-containing protein [Salinibacter sp.]|uniref:lasso RiPP family leader peptide-containing protein n=1 Tax=Salinibacter sp. TaxID=2065818 RepID=UPI003D7642B4
MSNKAQKNWNAPSLTEHGSVEELTAVDDPYGGLTPEQRDRICESSDLGGSAGYRALCGS